MTETYHPKGLVRALENVPRRGVASIILSGLLLTAHDAAVKSVSDKSSCGSKRRVVLSRRLADLRA